MKPENTYQDKNWLKQKYIREEMSMIEIADGIGVSESTICNWVNKHGIESRSISEARELVFEDDGSKYRDRDWLRSMYWGEGKSAYEIADMCDVSHSTIQYFLDKNDINTRSQPESTRARNDYPKYYDKDWLTNMYEERGKSTVEIAEDCGVTTAAIRHWIHKHEIEMRSLSEAMVNRGVGGKNHPRWKGGRDYYYGKNWGEMREKAIQRDSERCQACGITRREHRDKYGNDLHVHHITPLSEFESVENANSLDNLITLCHSDHRTWEGIPVQPQLAD